MHPFPSFNLEHQDLKLLPPCAKKPEHSEFKSWSDNVIHSAKSSVTGEICMSCLKKIVPTKESIKCIVFALFTFNKALIAAHWLDLVARVLLFRLLFYTKM